MGANGITSIEFVDNLGSSPASTHRPTGKVWVNKSFLGPQMRKRYWDFILDHEEGHIVLNTKSEFAADAYALTKFLNKYAAEPMDAVKALTEVLPMNTAEQRERVRIITEKAQKFDCEHNGKCKPDNQISNFMPRVATNYTDGPVNGQPLARKKPRVATNISPRVTVKSFFGIPVLTTAGFSSFNPTTGSTGYGIDAWGALAPMGKTNAPSLIVDADYEKEYFYRPYRQCDKYISHSKQQVCLSEQPARAAAGLPVYTAPAEEVSNFTNCSKYLIPGRRKNCEAENQRERDVQIQLQQKADETKIAIAKLQISASSGLANVLSASMGQPAYEEAPATAPAKQGSNGTMILIVVVAAAIAIGAALYFMGGKKTA